MQSFLLYVITCAWLIVYCSYGRTYELFSRDQLHDMLLDTPVGNRPATVIAIYTDTDKGRKNLEALNFNDNNMLSTEYLIFFKYELSTFKERIWHDYEKHLDLVENLPTNIQEHINKHKTDQIPVLLFLSVDYAEQVKGDYLIDPVIREGEYSIWNPQLEKDWRKWVWSNLKLSIRLTSTIPFDYEITLTHHRNNPFYQNKGDNRIVQKFSSHFSYSYLNDVYIGDEFFVSQNPTNLFNNQQYEIDADGNIVEKTTTTNELNPTVTIIPGNNRKYFLKHNQETNLWYFDIEKYRTDIPEELLRARHITTYMNHGRNLILPLVIPYKNSPGFKKIKMPPGLHDRLMQFYRKWYHLREAENWDNTATQLNYIETKSYMVSLDHNYTERNIIANDIIRPILEEWSGYNLDFTAFYGLREYTRGAVLSNHVDRSETHIFSAILQIAQFDNDEDWQLEVIGLDGHFYRISMEPGEMVLYEGATLPHGRPKPFNGTGYVNAFCHFKPAGWEVTSTSRLFRTPKALELMRKMHVTYEDLNSH